MKSTYIYLASFQQHLNNLDNYLTTLNQDEIARAKRFVTRELHDNYCLARGILRKILADFLQCSPETIEFIYNKYNKPQLSKKFADSLLEFNLSHAKDYVVYALQYQYPIGIDIEYIDHSIEHERLAQRFFTQEEANRLIGLDNSALAKEFFKIWTCKEAYIKAIGMGLSTSLKKFIVNYENENDTGYVTNLENNKNDLWYLRTYAPQNDYQVAMSSNHVLTNCQFYNLLPDTFIELQP